jgi:hypothetical protein
MKTEFWKEIQVFEDLNLANVSKKDFARVFRWAYLWVFTPETIKAAFAAIGLHPFNPEVITDIAMGSQPPTALELSPSHFATVSTHTGNSIAPTCHWLPPLIH